MYNLPDDAAAWSVTLTLPCSALDAVAKILGEHAAAVATHSLETCDKTENTPEDLWRLTAYCADAARGAVLAVLAKEILSELGLAETEISIKMLPETDWVAQNARLFPLLFAGRFVVHGDHLRPPPGRIALCVNAGSAFGSGSHGSTRGCLLALDRIANRRRIARALDLGTGSGILAIAIAKCWGGGGMGVAEVLAADIDPAAVAATKETAEANGVAKQICCVTSDGFAAPKIGGGAPYDLICANILANPLQLLAAELARHLARDGIAIISGLLVSQEATVTEHYRDAGLKLVDQIQVGNWSSLLLTW